MELGQSNIAVTVNYTFGGQEEIELAEMYPVRALSSVNAISAPA
jgi:hypothetical protein